MADERSDRSGFPTADDAPVRYIERIRDYYMALGYGAPYEWAHYADVPFQRLRKPLAECRVALITTAAPYQADKGDQGPGAPYNAAAKFYSVYSGDAARDHDLRISHVAIDREHTTAEDPGNYFPLPELRRATARGRVGAVAPRFHGLPTNRSQRTTLDVDCPELVARCKADGADAVVLIANCPVCHQSVSLAARMLEKTESPRSSWVAPGTSSSMSACRACCSLTSHSAMPRAGRTTPNRKRSTLELALALLERAPAARTTVQSPLVWSTTPDWKLDYSNAARLSPAEIARRRAEFDKQKTVAKDVRESIA